MQKHETHLATGKFNCRIAESCVGASKTNSSFHNKMFWNNTDQKVVRTRVSAVSRTSFNADYVPLLLRKLPVLALTGLPMAAPGVRAAKSAVVAPGYNPESIKHKCGRWCLSWIARMQRN